jgi:hypothetical protein
VRRFMPEMADLLAQANLKNAVAEETARVAALSRDGGGGGAEDVDALDAFMSSVETQMENDTVCSLS